jgi:orotidine-5'-phosphate decarboxylase
MITKSCMASVLMASSVFANEVFKTLDERMVTSNSLVCVGLDPDITKMPLEISNTDLAIEDKIYTFLTQIIDITAPHVCSYKTQKAFYDQYDGGHALLKRTIAYVHNNYPGIPVFVDCKIGDTDNTMRAYMHLFFEDLAADGVVINPYMGDDVLEPFILDRQKVAVVLIQTSNKNAKVVQELQLSNGKKLWEEMLHLLLSRWNVNKNIIVVLSSNTDAGDYALIRQQIPQDTPILLAGIGAQGGDPIVMQRLLNENKRGVFVNSSRGILYPYDRADVGWKEAVLNATLELKNLLNTIRDQ